MAFSVYTGRTLDSRWETREQAEKHALYLMKIINADTRAPFVMVKVRETKGAQ